MQIQLPAIKIPVFGLKDTSHIMWHGVKTNKNPFDAGVDLFPSSLQVAHPYDGWVEVWVATLFHMAFQPGTFGWVTDRSSTSRVTQGATVLPGIIDAGYTGELIIRLKVTVTKEYEDFLKSDHRVIKALNHCIENRQAIAQIVPLAAYQAIMGQVDPAKLPNLGRGTNGFGSTNKKG
jgi:dUTPase